MSVTETEPVAKLRIVEWGVPAGEGREVMVRRDREDSVRVTWVCGDARTFSLADLEQAMGHIDAVKDFGDVWVEHKDTHGYRFFGRVIDGEFYADTHTGGDGYHVPWDLLKKALKKASE